MLIYFLCQKLDKRVDTDLKLCSNRMRGIFFYVAVQYKVMCHLARQTALILEHYAL